MGSRTGSSPRSDGPRRTSHATDSRKAEPQLPPGAAALLTLIVLLFSPACVSEEQVEREMEDANYCVTAEECVVIYPGCPLGCWSFVNEEEEGRIRDLVESFFDQQVGEQCMYDCAGHGEVRCENDRCVADQL